MRILGLLTWVLLLPLSVMAQEEQRTSIVLETDSGNVTYRHQTVHHVCGAEGVLLP